MALIIWRDEPREVPGFGLIAAKQEVSVKEELANQFISQGFARAKKKPKKKKK